MGPGSGIMRWKNPLFLKGHDEGEKERKGGSKMIMGKSIVASQPLGSSWSTNVLVTA